MSHSTAPSAGNTRVEISAWQTGPVEPAADPSPAASSPAAPQPLATAPTIEGPAPAAPVPPGVITQAPAPELKILAAAPAAASAPAPTDPAATVRPQTRPAPRWADEPIEAAPDELIPLPADELMLAEVPVAESLKDRRLAAIVALNSPVAAPQELATAQEIVDASPDELVELLPEILPVDDDYGVEQPPPPTPFAVASPPPTPPAIKRLPATPILPRVEETANPEEEGVSDETFQKRLTAVLGSMAINMLLMVIAGFWHIEMFGDGPREIVVADVSTDSEVENFEGTEIEPSPLADDLKPDVVAPTRLEEEIVPDDDITNSSSTMPAPVAVDVADGMLADIERPDFMTEIGGSNLGGSGLGSRSEENREGLGKARGASTQSEAAVAKALIWLAAHQADDGAWSFDHGANPTCRRDCSNPGDRRSARLAATGLALLPFLGAGNTHKKGAHKEVVRKGVYYLVKHGRLTENGVGFNHDQGVMYGHGICAIALCEAYGMTRDPALEKTAQGAIDFIAHAQDPRGGGWRYDPRQPGDTSVVGWQLMALKSAHLSYLKVQPETIALTDNFLNSVQSSGGATYGYIRPAGTPATSAIGLLCRMYMGWPKSRPALKEGVRRLGELGPSERNMYYNYYATQVMSHWEGKEWEDWNPKMRDFLVASQATQGHAKGSWYFAGEDLGAREGGRLYCTAMAAMILEVYYRYLPIYSPEAGGGGGFF